MTSDVNQRILEKIEKGKFSAEVKSFLRLMLGQELDHFTEDAWRYGKVYETEILKAVRQPRSRKGE